MIYVGQSVHSRYVDGNLAKLETELAQIEDAGADSCELILHCLDVVVGGQVISARQAGVLDILRAHNLRYTMHMPYDMNFQTTEFLDLYVSAFRAGINFAQTAGIEVLVHHFGKASTHDPARLTQEIQVIKDFAESAPDLPFCMENPTFFTDFRGYSVGQSAESMISFVEHIGLPNVKLTFDVGHSFLNHRGNAEAVLQELAQLLPYIRHVHLHDNCGLPFAMWENDYIHRLACGTADLHLPLGWGCAPIAQALALLKGTFNGTINLEIEERFHDQYSESIALVRRLLA